MRWKQRVARSGWQACATCPRGQPDSTTGGRTGLETQSPGACHSRNAGGRAAKLRLAGMSGDVAGGVPDQVYDPPILRWGVAARRYGCERAVNTGEVALTFPRPVCRFGAIRLGAKPGTAGETNILPRWCRAHRLSTARRRLRMSWLLTFLQHTMPSSPRGAALSVSRGLLPSRPLGGLAVFPRAKRWGGQRPWARVTFPVLSPSRSSHEQSCALSTLLRDAAR